MKRFKLWDNKKTVLGEFDTFFEAWEQGTDYKVTTGNTYFIEDTSRLGQVLNQIKEANRESKR